MLQSVDLGDRFGSGWLPAGGKSAAASLRRTATGTWPQPGSGDTGGVSVELWSSSAKVTVTGSDTVGSTCLGLGPGALAGSVSLGGHLVVVAGPGVVTVELRSTSGATVPGSSRKVAPTTGSPFQVADLPAATARTAPATGSWRSTSLVRSSTGPTTPPSPTETFGGWNGTRRLPNVSLRRGVGGQAPSQARIFCSHSRIGAMSQYSSRWCATLGSPGP